MAQPTVNAAPIWKRARLTVKGRQATWGLIFILPAVVYFAIFWVYPLLNSFVISTTNWDLLTRPKFVGLDNFIMIFWDENFRKAVGATLAFAFGSGIPTAILALFLALLVNRPLPGLQLFRTLLFIPAVTSWVVAAIVWRMIYLPDQGLYLLLFEPFGITHVQWLMSRDLAMIAAIIMAVWKQIGPNILVFLAGLQTMPDDVFDAAKVDGANRLQTLAYITLPLLQPTTVFVGIMLVISSLQNFTPMFVLTGGGPANVTRTISLLIYQEGFQFFHMGKASAMSTIMFAAVLAFSIFNIRTFGGRNR